MMLKVIILFLLAMAVLAMFGKLRFPKAGRGKRARRCPDCDRPLIGKGTCPCRARG